MYTWFFKIQNTNNYIVKILNEIDNLYKALTWIVFYFVISLTFSSHFTEFTTLFHKLIHFFESFSMILLSFYAVYRHFSARSVWAWWMKRTTFTQTNAAKTGSSAGSASCSAEAKNSRWNSSVQIAWTVRELVRVIRWRRITRFIRITSQSSTYCNNIKIWEWVPGMCRARKTRGRSVLIHWVSKKIASRYVICLSPWRSSIWRNGIFPHLNFTWIAKISNILSKIKNKISCFTPWLRRRS